MMGGYGLEGAFTVIVVGASLVGAAIMGILFWVIPWLWSLVKPWLHMVTA